MPRKPPSFWTLDCETDPFSEARAKAGIVPQPFIWGAYNGDTEVFETFKTPGEVADFFRDKRTLVYAHNGGKFDYHYMRDDINSDEKILVIAGRLAKFRIGLCEFRDSSNLLPVALAEFGDKTEIDYALMEPERRSDPNVYAEICRYHRNDCVSLWHKIKRFFDEYGKQITIASTAVKYWQEMSGIKIPRQNKVQHDLYKRFYFGGRVECFTSGAAHTQFDVADINSAYPFAMLSSHPFSVNGRISGQMPHSADITNSLFYIRASSQGAFPLRTEDGSLFFPVDSNFGRARRSRDYFVTGWELLAAMERNAVQIHKIHEVHTFDQTMHFSDYVQRFYEKRQTAKDNNDKPGDVLAKLMMNGFYGKLAADGAKYHEYVIATSESLPFWLEGIDPHTKKPCGKFVEYKRWDNSRYLLRAPLSAAKQNQSYYNVATAASITGFVRAHLYKSILDCSGTIYCDTDSIAARETSRLEIGKRLGQWKLEMRCDQYGVAGKKLYAFRESQGKYTDGYGYYDRKNKTGSWKIACKGVRLTPDEITRIAAGEEVEYTPEVPTYSISRTLPRYINRNVLATYKNLDELNA